MGLFYSNSNSSENLIPRNLGGSGGGLQALGLSSWRKGLKREKERKETIKTEIRKVERPETKGEQEGRYTEMKRNRA